jgi:ubiquinol-cytochrome c reductase cytochrome b subunit
VAFEQRGCINCHRIAGVGGQRGPDLTTVGKRLTTDELTWRILSGGRNMPAYGATMTPQDTTALVEFLSGRQ